MFVGARSHKCLLDIRLIQLGNGMIIVDSNIIRETFITPHKTLIP